SGAATNSSALPGCKARRVSHSLPEYTFYRSRLILSELKARQAAFHLHREFPIGVLIIATYIGAVGLLGKSFKIVGTQRRIAINPAGCTTWDEYLETCQSAFQFNFGFFKRHSQLNFNTRNATFYFKLLYFVPAQIKIGLSGSER